MSTLQAASVLKKTEGILTIIVCNPKAGTAAAATAGTQAPTKKEEAKPSKQLINFFSLFSFWAFTVCVEGKGNGCLGDGFLPPHRFSFRLFALDPYLWVSLKSSPIFGYHIASIDILIVEKQFFF